MASSLPSIAADNLPKGGTMATTVYFEMLMDLYQAGEILALREKTLKFWDFLSPEEQTRVLDLCKGCEDWDHAYIKSLEPKALEDMLDLYAKRLEPEELKQLLKRLQSRCEASGNSEYKLDRC
jgi:hypothetical protein